MTEINVLLLAGRGNMKIKIIRNIFFFFQLVTIVAKHWKISFEKLFIYFFYFCKKSISVKLIPLIKPTLSL